MTENSKLKTQNSSKKQRRDSRVLALETIFAFLSRDEKITLSKTFSHVLEDIAEKKSDDFAKEILTAATENLAKVKLLIKAFAPEYAYEKIAPINRAILILGITEMKFINTPPVVVINEYIDLAKDFGEDKSGGFINGVLDSYRKSLGLNREKPANKISSE